MSKSARARIAVLVTLLSLVATTMVSDRDAQARAASPRIHGRIHSLESASTAGTPTEGHAIIFQRTYAAFQEGHVGWGYFDPATGQWTFGAIEGDPDHPFYIARGDDNGAWSDTGDFDAMTHAMVARGYDDYIHVKVASPHVAAARRAAEGQAGIGYSLLFTNCLTASEYPILTAYGAILPPVTGVLGVSRIPNNWATDVVELETDGGTTR